MNKKRKNISLIIGINKKSSREKGRNLSQNMVKSNNRLDNQKSMFIRNLDKTINITKIPKSQNKSFDISTKGKSIDPNDRKSENNGLRYSQTKNYSPETNEEKQMTPMFSKVNQYNKAKFVDVSKSSSFNNPRNGIESKIRDKVLKDSKNSFSRNNKKNGSFDFDQNTSLNSNLVNKTNHSFAFNSHLIYHLNNTIKTDKDKRESKEDLLKIMEEKLNNLEKNQDISSTDYYIKLSNTYKAIFNDLKRNISSLKEFKIIVKIVEGYHHTTIDLLNKIKQSQERFKELEEKLCKANDEKLTLNKLVLLKDRELEKTKLKLLFDKTVYNHIQNGKEKSVRIGENSPNLVLTNDVSIIGGNEDNPQQILENFENKIKSINQHNIDDLDAIYFPDKVKMRSNSASSNNVPKLNFNAVKLFDSNKLFVNKQNDFKNVEIDPLKIRVVKNSNASHNLKNYVNTNSNKKVFINIDHNIQDKINNKFNK